MVWLCVYLGCLVLNLYLNFIYPRNSVSHLVISPFLLKLAEIDEIRVSLSPSPSLAQTLISGFLYPTPTGHLHLGALLAPQS